MQRPSHLAFGLSSPANARRLPMIVLAIGMQMGIAWLFAHGLRGVVPGFEPPLRYIDVKPVKKHTDPPPLPFDLKPVVNRIDPVIFTVAQPPRDNGGITVDKDAQTASNGGTGPVAPVYSAASAIKGTHTLPPYPPIARRLGVEGKVTLRLTVLADGSVGKAEIVTSSGRDDLDEAARQWIVRHWTYRPATSDGTPAASQTLAEVTFNLKNE